MYLVENADGILFSAEKEDNSSMLMDAEIKNAVCASDTEAQYDEKAKRCWEIKSYWRIFWQRQLMNLGGWTLRMLFLILRENR